MDDGIVAEPVTPMKPIGLPAPPIEEKPAKPAGRSKGGERAGVGGSRGSKAVPGKGGLPPAADAKGKKARLD